MDSVLHPNLIPSYFTMAIVLPLGIYVYLVNPRRASNKIYLLMTVSLGFWVVCLGNTFIAKTNEQALYWFRITNCASVPIPLLLHFMRMAIVDQGKSLPAILRQSAFWVALATAIGLLTLSPIFSSGAELSPGLGIPKPQYGPGVFVFGAYMIVGVLWVMASYVKEIRQTRGLQRIELQYLLLGTAFGWSLGQLLATVLQVLRPGSDGIIYAPTSMLFFYLMLAYGIATERLMGVADAIRRVFSYALLGLYLLGVFSVISLLSQMLFRDLLATQSELPYLLASLAVVASVAPASGFLRKFSHSLFLRLETIDTRNALRQFNQLAREVKTTHELLSQFSRFIGETLGTDKVFVLLPNGEGNFVQAHPMVANAEPILLRPAGIILKKLSESSEPLSRDMLQRQRLGLEGQELFQRMKSFEISVVGGAYSKQHLQAVLLLGTRLSGRIYGRIEQELIQTLLNSLSLVLENSTYFTEVENSKIYNDILLENLLSGVLATDPSGIITVCNHEVGAMLGRDTTTLVGNHYRVLPEELAHIVAETIEQRLVGDSLFLQIRGLTEHVLQARISRSFISGHSGKPLGALLVLEDETNVRQLEMQLRRGERLSRLGTLSALMAHSIQLPLVIIKDLLEKLPQNFDNPVFRDGFVSIVSREVTKFDTSVRDLLRFARSKEPVFRSLSLLEIVKSAVGAVGSELQAKGVSLVVDMPTDFPLVGDDEMLQQALVRSISHATLEVPRGCSLKITAAALDGHVEVGIRQFVPDIDADASALRDERGSVEYESDLGIEISKEIVTEHGGTLEVTFDAHFGRTVWCRLPVQPSATRVSP